MKLHCSKCDKQLTTDLYKAKVSWVKGLFGHKCVFNTWSILDRIPKNDYDEYANMKSGLFYETKCNLKFNNKYDDELPAQIVRKEKSQFVVAQGSILDDIIPPFKSGGGCCNYGGEELSCSCGILLGDSGKVEITVKVYTNGVTTKYKIDRLD